jgi:hypothetical protein
MLLIQIQIYQRHFSFSPETPKVSYRVKLLRRNLNPFSLPQLSLECTFLLYAVSIVYMDVLRLSRYEATRRYRHMVLSTKQLLERYSHPAAALAHSMGQDLLANLLSVTRSISMAGSELSE